MLYFSAKIHENIEYLKRAILKLFGRICIYGYNKIQSSKITITIP